MLAVALGAALVAAGAVDLIWTTLATSAGGGPLTSRTSRALWALFAPKGREQPHHGRLRLLGLSVVLSVLLLWVSFFVVGWLLLFHGAPHAVVDATTRDPASTWQRLHYALATLSTLGIGDYVPGDDVWRILTGVAATSGLAFTTLTISYLIPVLQSVTQRRTLALQISSMGRNPTEIVINALPQDDGTVMTLQMVGMNESVSRLAQQHLSYPVLHYFHDVSVQAAGAVQIAVLDETMTLLRLAIDGDRGPDRRAVSALRHSVGSLLETLRASHIALPDRDPPAPGLGPLREAGLPVVDDETFARRLEAVAGRRRALLAFVEEDGWSWHDVYRSPEGQSVLDSDPDDADG